MAIKKGLSYFRVRKEKFIEQPTVAKLFPPQRLNMAMACLLALMSAESRRPHTVSEKLIIPPISEVTRLCYTNHHLRLSRKFL